MLIKTIPEELTVTVDDGSKVLQVDRPCKSRLSKNGTSDLLAQLREAFETWPPSAAEAQSASPSIKLKHQILEKWLLSTKQENVLADRLRPAKLVAEHFGICLRTLDRWLADEHLNFPRPITVKRRRYFREVDLVAWEIGRRSRSSAEAQV